MPTPLILYTSCTGSRSGFSDGRLGGWILSSAWSKVGPRYHGALDVFSVEAVPFDGLLVAAAMERGASVLLRGIRGSHDWDHEMQMAFANQQLSEGALETVFLTPSPGTSMISGTLVREVASLGGDPSPWVSPAVAAALRDRFPSA